VDVPVLQAGRCESPVLLVLPVQLAGRCESLVLLVLPVQLETGAKDSGDTLL